MDIKTSTHHYDGREVYRGHSYQGRLISFEGRDQSGKTTQYKMFLDYLKANRYSFIKTREPGGTLVGERIRKILLEHDESNIEPSTELLLFEASRGQLVSEIIRPALQQGNIVAVDRFYDSTTAYQGSAGKVPLYQIMVANYTATQGISADLTAIFDVTPEIAIKRKGMLQDRMEQKGEEFQERVRQAFLGIAKLEPERVKVIDANTEDKNCIHEEVIKHFERMIESTNYQRKQQNP